MFVVGSAEGYAARDLMATGPARVKASFDVKMEPNLKTALVWGTLPGTTDETIVIIAHRDGWFDAAGDNASGVASMIALAESLREGPASTAAPNHGVHWLGRTSQLR